MNARCDSQRTRTSGYWSVFCGRRWFCSSSSRQIVDSIMALFRVDFSGRGELSERQQKVSRCSSPCEISSPHNPVVQKLAQVWIERTSLVLAETGIIARCFRSLQNSPKNTTFAFALFCSCCLDRTFWCRLQYFWQTKFNVRFLSFLLAGLKPRSIQPTREQQWHS